MNVTRSAIAVLSVTALIAGGISFAVSAGTTTRGGEIAALVLGLVVVGGAIAFGQYISASSIRSANQDAVRLAAQFGRLAERTGLRVQRGEDVDHPVAGTVLGAPALVGTYRGHWVRIQWNVADDMLGAFEIVVRAPDGVIWPKLGRLRGSGSPAISPSGRAALERLNARRRRPWRLGRVSVSETTLRGVTDDLLTRAPESSVDEGLSLEAILDDLIALADGLGGTREQAVVVGPTPSSTTSSHGLIARRVIVLSAARAMPRDVVDGLTARAGTVRVLGVDAGSLRDVQLERPDVIVVWADATTALSVCNRLKRMASLEDVPTVLVSPDPAEDLFRAHRKLATRADDYVRGPIEASELIVHLEKVLGGEAKANP